MARNKKGLPIDGIINLDKPLGLSSNQALQKVKKLLNAKKAGHTGSLDPLASGVLPLCFGHATKVSALLLDSDKGYLAGIHLGCRTTTGDKEGEIINPVNYSEIEKNKIVAILKQFEGEQHQLPPMYSALKFQGQPLYKLARKGIEIKRETREITIYSIKLIDYQYPQLVIDVRCSKGTYIRTLAEDIGTALGCGAHLFSLRRVQAGSFLIADSYTLEQLTELQQQRKIETVLNGSDSVLLHLPRINLSKQSADDIRLGRKITIFVDSAVTKGNARLDYLTMDKLKINQSEEQLIRLYEQELFIGLAQLQIDSSPDEIIYLLQPKRLFC
ncbi:MAG: tRNA pseudouridine(55) synthase TruB [Pseudomonadota bacterium]